MMSDQNPHPGDTCHSQIPVGCPTPPPLGLDLIGALGLFSGFPLQERWVYHVQTGRKKKNPVTGRYLMPTLVLIDTNFLQVYAPARGGGGGGWVLPYMGYIVMCGPKGYGFSAVLVITRVSILADFDYVGHR